MGYEAEISFLCRALTKCGVQALLFPRADPPVVDLGLRENIHMLNLKNTFFSSMEHRTLYAIDDALLCHYNALLIPDSDDVLLIGPYLTQEVSEQVILTLMDKHHLPSSMLPLLTHYYKALPLILISDSMMLGLMDALVELLWGSDSSYETKHVEHSNLSDIIRTEDPAYLNKIMDAADLKLMEERYEAENRLMYAVAHGMTHQAQLMISRANEHVLEQRTMDSLRNIKNYGVILNVLLRKAAEEGAVHPLHIDQLSSTMARRLDPAH